MNKLIISYEGVPKCTYFGIKIIRDDLDVIEKIMKVKGYKATYNGKVLRSFKALKEQVA